MSAMKPLMSPRPRRRDRPAGPRTEWLHDAILSPVARRVGTRDPVSKRRAMRRLLDRRRDRSVSWELVIALGLLTALAVFFV